MTRGIHWLPMVYWISNKHNQQLQLQLPTMVSDTRSGDSRHSLATDDVLNLKQTQWTLIAATTTMVSDTRFVEFKFKFNSIQKL